MILWTLDQFHPSSTYPNHLAILIMDSWGQNHIEPNAFGFLFCEPGPNHSKIKLVQTVQITLVAGFTVQFPLFWGCGWGGMLIHGQVFLRLALCFSFREEAAVVSSSRRRSSAAVRARLRGEKNIHYGIDFLAFLFLSAVSLPTN